MLINPKIGELVVVSVNSHKTLQKGDIGIITGISISVEQKTVELCMPPNNFCTAVKWSDLDLISDWGFT